MYTVRPHHQEVGEHRRNTPLKVWCVKPHAVNIFRYLVCLDFGTMKLRFHTEDCRMPGHLWEHGWLMHMVRHSCLCYNLMPFIKVSHACCQHASATSPFSLYWCPPYPSFHHTHFLPGGMSFQMHCLCWAQETILIPSLHARFKLPWAVHATSHPNIRESSKVNSDGARMLISRMRNEGNLEENNKATVPVSLLSLLLAAKCARHLKGPFFSRCPGNTGILAQDETRSGGLWSG